MTREELLKIAKPVLFNTEMVIAILEDRKTVTRRIVKFLDGKNPNWTGYIKDGLTLYNGTNEPCNKKPPFQVGDYLYVRETWQYLYELDGNEKIIEETGRYYYKATDTIPFDTYVDSMEITHETVPWKPSIHMPKEAARIFLKVNAVRVERLQDITISEMKKEGLIDECEYCTRGIDCNVCIHEDGIIDEWQELWNSTIKTADMDQYGWEANPWVWVVEFERVEV